jgi:hypothetical protein
MHKRRHHWSLLVLAIFVACTSDSSKPQTGTTIELERIAFELPAGWEAQTPGSKMRAAQANIPGEAGTAQLAVFFFGEGQGGGADENIRRWISQVDFPPGSSTDRQQFDAHGYLVTWVDFEGTLKPAPMAGGPKEPQPSSRLLGAVVEGPGGPWFFKATGPSATLASQRDAFIAMLESIRGK